jgi:glutamyl-tRNA reductase
MIAAAPPRAPAAEAWTGADPASMAAASVRLAACIFGRIADQSVLFIGGGGMIELCAAEFCARGPRRVTAANRNPERARHLARRICGAAIALGEVPEHLALHDIVITRTLSPLPILGKGMMERAIRSRRHRPIFIVDLGVPRDVEPEVAELDDVFLYTLGDLAGIAREGVGMPQRAAA